MKLSVILPVFNEEGNLLPLYRKLVKVLKQHRYSYEIIFIDDGSTDNSYNILKKIYLQDKKHVKVIKFRKNYGQTASINSGFKYSNGDILITMDSDLQNDPSDIPKLLNKLKEGYDVVSGWRYNRKDGFSKKVMSRFSNWLHRKLTGLNIHDSGCTLKAYKREVIKDLELYGEIHRYIPALTYWKGFKIAEVKVRHHPRIYGKTKYNWKRLVKGLLDLINIKFWMQYSSRPLHLFGAFGLLQIFFGGLLFTYLIIMRLFFNEPLSDRPLFLLSILTVIGGFQFLILGFLSDIMIKVYYGGRHEPYNIEKILR